MDELDHLSLFGEYFEIVCGTTEEFLIAFSMKYGKDGKFALNSTFANHSHISSIRRLLVCGPHLVSGGGDEMIHVFNLKRRNKIGVIGEHQGTITDLQQHKQKYIFSAADDGKICIFKEGFWECEKRLLGHRGPVNSLAIHPSGRLAISVGVDRTLHTWDLVKGRKAYVSTLKDVGAMVKWSPSGDQYIVVVDSRVDVYLVKSAMITYSIDFYVRINDIAFITEHMFIVALENGKLAIHDVRTERSLQQWEAHTNRVRAMELMPTVASRQDHPKLYLVTGSSDGWLKVWALQKSDFRIPAECVTEKNTQCRITCLAVYTDDAYKQMMKSRTLERVNEKADQMLERSQRSGTPRTALTAKRAHQDASSEEDKKPHITPVPQKKKKTKKKVTVREPESEEEEEEEDEEEDDDDDDDDDDEDQEDTNKVEVITGAEALKLLGCQRSSEAVYKTKTVRAPVSGEETTNRTGRKNRGLPPKRFLD